MYFYEGFHCSHPHIYSCDKFMDVVYTYLLTDYLHLFSRNLTFFVLLTLKISPCVNGNKVEGYVQQAVLMIFFCITTAIAVYHAGFGQGTGPVLLNHVRCTGTESSLLSCSGYVIGTSCSHWDDVGVACPPCKPLSLLSCCHMDSGNGFIATMCNAPPIKP